jgi:gamma-polyglutamate biosynthesis protein CapA
MSKKTAYWFLISCLTIGVGIGVFLGFTSLPAFQKNEPASSEIQDTPLVHEQSLKIIFVGDIMMDRGVKSSVVKNFNGDYNQLFAFTDYLAQADIAIGNLEGPASDLGKNVGSKYSFRMDPAVISALATAGFNGLSLANNHAGDWTIDAHTDTVRRLQQAGIKPIGAGNNLEQALTPTVFSQKGFDIALFGCTDVGPTWLSATAVNPGILLCNHKDLVSAISLARQSYDLVIVTPHWGDEYVGYNQKQQTLAHAWVDAGAHAVIGHHPHVIQETQWYNDGFIAYSLGNFIFDQHFSAETMQGMVLEMTINHEGILAVQKYINPLSRIYQPQPLRELSPDDVVVKKTTTTQPVRVFTCPAGNSDYDHFLTPVSYNRSVGDYIPKNLVSVRGKLPTSDRDMCLEKTVVDMAKIMIDTARQSGFNLVVTSAFRDFNHQKNLWRNDQSRLEKNNQLLPIAAPAGSSEHQLGTAIDVVAQDAITLELFSTSDAYFWMRENAHLFGFVQSYQAGFESVNGYIAEPWHWRYVGVEHATAVYDQQIPLVTYLENLEN